MKTISLKFWFNKYAKLPILIITLLIVAVQIAYIFNARKTQINKRDKEVERLVSVANLGILSNDRAIIETTLDVVTHDMGAKRIFFCEQSELITSYPTLSSFDCSRPVKAGFGEELLAISPKGTPQFVFYFYFPFFQGLKPIFFMLFAFIVFSIFIISMLQLLQKRIRNDLISPIESLTTQGAVDSATKILELENIASKNRLINQLKEADALAKQAQFMAHDIRRPFSQVKMVLALFNSFASEPQKLDNAKKEIESAIKNVESMLSDLIESNKEGPLNITACTVERLIDEAIAQTGIESKSIKLVKDLGSPVMLLCDEQKLARCFVNILENATDAGATEIEVFLKGAELVIANNGPCFQEEDIPKLFERFFTKGKKKGIGLGLAFVYRTILLHNGTIKARNRANGNGVEFVITLSLLQDINLLVLDDDAFYRDLVKSLIKENKLSKNIRVSEVASVKEALSATKKENITHALVDLDLGNNTTGFDYVEQAKRSGLNVSIGVHTNKFLDKNVKEQMTKYNVVYIPKPLDINKLCSFIYSKNS